MYGKPQRLFEFFKKVAHIKNYRLIDTMSNFSKLFEICINKSLYYYISNYIIPQQHGFVSKRSTVSKLV